MGPTWCPSGAGRTHVSPMWATWILLSGTHIGLLLSGVISVHKVYIYLWIYGVLTSNSRTVSKFLVSSREWYTYIVSRMTWNYRSGLKVSEENWVVEWVTGWGWSWGASILINQNQFQRLNPTLQQKLMYISDLVISVNVIKYIFNVLYGITASYNSLGNCSVFVSCFVAETLVPWITRKVLHCIVCLINAAWGGIIRPTTGLINTTSENYNCYWQCRPVRCGIKISDLDAALPFQRSFPTVGIVLRNAKSSYIMCWFTFRYITNKYNIFSLIDCRRTCIIWIRNFVKTPNMPTFM